MVLHATSTPTTHLHPYHPILHHKQQLPTLRSRRLSTPSAMSTTTDTTDSQAFDRAAAVKAFDESRTGVKGLLDSGITTIPSLFIHPNPAPTTKTNISIPTIDLSLPNSTTAPLAAKAAREWGFFHIINHSISAQSISKTLDSIRRFNEQPAAARAEFYSRSMVGGVSYSSNVDLYRSSAASWRDTIQVACGHNQPDWARIPPVCRDEIKEWDEKVSQVGKVLLGLLSEGLGLRPMTFEEKSCLDGKLMVCHYYPPCPEPDKTMGLVAHTDPGVLTVLVQDDKVGGLQVKKMMEDGESCWVDVEPVPGALVINVGDLLQIMSNDEYKSVEHRVVINSREEARVSIGVFFNPGKRGDSDLYGPLPELVSPEKPAKYRNFTMSEFMGTFFSGQLASKALIDHFKI